MRAVWARLRGRFRPGTSTLPLALLLTIPAWLPLTAPGYFFDAHDAHHSVFFLVEFDQAIRAGVPWPVWGPDHAIGFGYPLWLLYAPLAFYVAEALHLLGLGFTAAVKATWALAFLAGAAGMYRLGRRWWGETAGLIAALAYTYAPYHFVQSYVRAALAEFVALAWFPWVLLAFAALWTRPSARRAGLAALAFAALLLTHTVSTLIFVPLLGGFLALHGLRDGWTGLRARQPDALRSALARPAAWTAVALGLGGLAAAIFLLPMLLERGYIVEAQWVQNTYRYDLHFVYPAQFFDPAWGFGYSVAGTGDSMSFQLGLVSFLGAAAFLGTQAAGRRKNGLIGWFFLAASLVTIFAMTPAAQPIWAALPLVGLIQFPWRLLALTTISLPLLTGAATAHLEERTAPSQPGDQPGPWAVVLGLVIVLASFPLTRPQLLPLHPEDESPLAVIEFETEHPDMRGMTAWSERPPLDSDSPLLAQYRAGQPLERAAVIQGQGTILRQEHDAVSVRASVRAEGEVRLRFYIYYFPGWQAWVDGRSVALTPDPPNGLIGLTLPAGDHDVRLRFGATPARRYAALISLLALAVVAALIAPRRR
jgi:hypothetical protein